MKAVRIHRFGAPWAMTIDDVEPPEPDVHEVLVKVHAAGVGPWDASVRTGQRFIDRRLPLTLGSDFSGTVVALGSGVHDFRLGDEVYGVTNPAFIGAYAEYTIARVDMLARKPSSLTHPEAAGVPVVAVTALQMVFDHAQLRAGQRVLIQGAAGGVGACAVQLARIAGAYVIGSDRPQRTDYVQSLGAHEVVDVSAQHLEGIVAPVDALIDCVGGEIQVRSAGLVKPGGVLVSSAGRAAWYGAATIGIRTRFTTLDVTNTALTQVAQAIDSGRLSVRIGDVYPLTQAREAHEALEGIRPRAPGRIVLVVG